MIRKSALAATIAALLTPAVAGALGLGNIEVSSALNEPLQARIPLRGVESGDLESLRAGIGTTEQFARAGLERVFVLTKLRFEVVETSAGSGFIRVTSRDPIAEPFLNFLVDVNWPRGRVLREYTVLLDPPVYGAAINTATRRAAAAVTSVTTAPAPPAGTAAPSSAPTAARSGRAAPATGSGAPRYAGDSYGPVREGETLWSIADRVRPAGVSIQNMMLALLRANPQAFAIDNVNALRTGAVLRIPSASEVAGDQAEALAAVARQQALWEEYRQSLPASVGVQPGGAAVPPAATPPTAAATPPASAAPGTSATGDQPPDSELRVVGGATAGAGTGTGASEDVQALRDELSLAQEEAEAARRENEELTSRLGEVETLVGDLKRLVELKEDQLAALQQQLAQMPPAGTAPGEVAPPSELQPSEPPPPATTEPATTEPATTEPTTMEPATMEPATTEPATMEPATTEPTTTEPTTMEPATMEPATMEPATMEPATTEPATTEPATMEPAPRPAPPPPPPPSFMDQVNAMLPVPLWTVLAALGALLFGIGGLRWARARGARNDDAGAVSPADVDGESMNDQYEPTELPRDADADEEATELPSAVAVPATVAAVDEAEPDDEDKTELARGDTGRMSPAPHGDEEDPLAEVNVYLAYERFDQAEQLVRDAISRYPNRDDYKLKLLEVFYAAKNVAAFETAAQNLRAAVGDDHESMQQARAWWQDLDAGRELFGAGAGEPTAAADDDLFDVTASDSGDETGVDFDLGFESADGEAASSGLDFDLGADERPAGDAQGSTLDFDLGGFDDEADAASGKVPGGTDLDFDLGSDADAPEPAAAGSDTGLDFDLGGLDEEQGDERGAAGTETTELPQRPAESSDTGLDFDVSGLDEGDAGAGEPDEGGDSLDFTLDDGDEAGGEPRPAAAAAADDEGVDSELDFDLSDTTTLGTGDKPVPGEVDTSGTSPDPDTTPEDEPSQNLSGRTTLLGGVHDDADDGAESELDFDLGDDADAQAKPGAAADDAGLDLDLDLPFDDAAADDPALSLDMDRGTDAPRETFHDAHTEVSDGSELDLVLDADDAGTAGAGDDNADSLLLDMDDDERPRTIDTVQLSAEDADSLRSEAGMQGDDAGPGDDDEQPFGVDTEFRDIFAAGSADAPGSETTSSLDFDLGTDLSGGPQDGEGDDENEDTQFMLRDVPADDGEDSEDHTLALGRGAAGEVDEMQTKLDLAQAYMDMGDTEGARNLLGEVMAEGADAQKGQAREMLSRLS